MKRLTTVILVLFSFISLIGQELSGRVVESSGDGVYYATLALYNAQDSSFLEGLSSDDTGKFKFKNLKDGNYYLIASMLSYDEITISDITVPGDNSNLLVTLTQDANIMNTIEITEKLPLMEQRADKLIVNVEGNLSNTSGSLLDVMKKVPGMLVINDRLSMVGSGTPTILLNGKTTQYMDVQALLKDMPGDNIKKVEIIHQPGAEYEASGSGPIINIILKKNSLFGTNGNVSLGVGKGELWDYTTGLNLSHYEGNFNINGGIGFSRNAWTEELTLTRRLTGISDQIDGNYDQVNDDRATPRTYRANLRMDWDVTEQHRLGVDSKIYNNENQRVVPNTTTVDIANELFQDYVLKTDNDIDKSWRYLSVNPYYIYEIDTSGQKLAFDVSMANYVVDGVNTLTITKSTDSLEDKRKYTQPGDTKIFATSLDYTKPLNKVFELKLGTKYSKADLDNDLQSEVFDGTEWVDNPLQSNHYLFDETIYAFYGKLNWKKNKWSGTTGLRFEKSESVGESLTLDSILTRPIQKLFPSFSLSRELVGPLKSSVSYSYRINRPRYSTLNPFVYYLDPFTRSQGNQNLRPSLTHSAKFTLTADGIPFFNIEYKKSNDAIVEVTQQDPSTEEAFKTDVNFDQQTYFSTSLFFPLEFIPGVIGGYGGGILSRNEYSSNLNEGDFAEAIWNPTFVLQLEFELPWEVHAELGGWYSGANQEGIFKSEYIYGTEIGFSKKFLNNKAKFSLGAEDVFNRFWHASVDYQQDLDLIVRWQAPVVNARFSYKFGNQHLKSKKKAASSAKDELQRASQGK